jgi:hypothetical protein
MSTNEIRYSKISNTEQFVFRQILLDRGAKELTNVKQIFKNFHFRTDILFIKNKHAPTLFTNLLKSKGLVRPFL